MKVNSYKILTGDSTSELTRIVLDHLGTGWQPYGSMQVIDDNTRYSYFQAMVKYKENVIEDILNKT